MTEIRDLRRASWFWMDKAIIATYGPHIGAYGVAVYALLAHYADSQGQAYPSLTNIARMLNISKQSVWRTLDLLVEHGLIERTARTSEYGGAKSNVYSLLQVTGSSPQEPGSSPQEPGSSPGELGVVPQGNGGSSPQEPEQDLLEQDPIRTRKDTLLVVPENPGTTEREISSSFSNASGRKKARTPEQKGYSPLFCAFYEAYPRKEDPDEAWKAWQQMDGDALADGIMAGVEAHRQSNEAWKRQERRYIKKPAAWLRAGAYKSDFARPVEDVEATRARRLAMYKAIEEGRAV